MRDEDRFMTDPISGAMARQALQPGAGAEAIDQASKTSPGGQTSFQDVMRQKTEASSSVDGPRAAESVDQTRPAQSAERVHQTHLDDFIDGILANEKDLQRMMSQCISGGAMSQQEMLQMQALIYAYSQKVDLTTKVVEKATGGLKQVMNTQV
jgi:hypothetical protein